MKIAVVNKYFPPDLAITGTSAYEFVSFLKARLPDAECRVFATSGKYRGGLAATATDNANVDRLPTVPLPPGRLWRFWLSLWEGMQLASRAVRWADVVVSMTDPPLLGFWIGRAVSRQKHKVRWIEWTMDLYPEAFACAGILNSRNPAYIWLQRRLQTHHPDRYICLGQNQARKVLELRRRLEPAMIVPCGVIGDIDPTEPAPPWRTRPDQTIMAYAGNLGEAHCAEVLVRLVRLADPNRTVFVFSAYGTKAELLKAQLNSCRNVVWYNHMNHAELAHADVHIASLLEHWTHVCVPSKAVSTVCMGKPLMFIGSKESDVWQILEDAAWHISPARDGAYNTDDLRAVLRQVADPDERSRKAAAAQAIAKRLNREKYASFEAIVAWIARTSL